jgi:hypothetical protein
MIMKTQIVVASTGGFRLQGEAKDMKDILYIFNYF